MSADPWILNCIVLDTNATIQEWIFQVSASPSITAYHLLSKIRREKRNHSPTLFELNLRLWRPIRDIPDDVVELELQRTLAGLSFADIDRGERWKNDDVEQLLRTRPLSEFFGVGPKPRCLHVIFRSPADADHPRGKRKRGDEDEEGGAIKLLQRKIGIAAPSSLAEYGSFKHIVGPDQPIALNRPYEHDTIPLTLHHPAFGNFKDRCKRAPSPRALKCLLFLTECTCKWYESEHARRYAVMQILWEHLDLQIADTAYNPDTNAALSIMPGLIRGCKNEAGSAMNQAILHYAHWVLEAMKRHHQFNTCFPCILMVDMGTQIWFYGSIWDGQRVRVEPLTRGLDLTINYREKRERDEMAAALDALVETTAYIREHYKVIRATDSWNDRRRGFPFLSSYIDIENGKTVDLTYSRRLQEDKLIFCAIGSGPDSGASSECIVKFTSQCYSYAAHEYLAKLKLAPRVRACVSISSDWTAIVMDKIDYPSFFHLKQEGMSDEKREKIRNKVQCIVRKLHEGGFVHGDVRDINVLVDPASLNCEDVVVFLIDFDWAGEIGKARYPVDVNRETVEQPGGVRRGELVLVEHDLEMVEYLENGVGTFVF
ncbi:hypothetical protein C0992_011645 [Termitomyces sp. T32_za158]|nr:hypothetical protein C0992_011645 [Termitomyces sp. T32_za158]